MTGLVVEISKLCKRLQTYYYSQMYRSFYRYRQMQKNAFKERGWDYREADPRKGNARALWSSNKPK